MNVTARVRDSHSVQPVSQLLLLYITMELCAYTLPGPCEHVLVIIIGSVCLRLLALHVRFLDPNHRRFMPEIRELASVMDDNPRNASRLSVSFLLLALDLLQVPITPYSYLSRVRPAAWCEADHRG